MFLSQLTTEKDREEAEKIERRRRQERQRKDRIFDTKSRIFGLDSAFLDEQVAAKERDRNEELRREVEFEEMDRKRAEEVAEMEREEMEAKRKIEEETNLFRKTSQQKESSREYDLNDKDTLKKETAPRVTDNDPWLSVSGAQKFAGEDLSHAERIRTQKEEQRDWLQRQMKEKQRREVANKERDRSIFSALIASANHEDEVEAMQRAQRNELSRLNAEYNQRLAKERTNKKLQDRMAEEKDNLAEIYNHLSSDILTESPETAQSALGRNRKVQYMYRGMSKTELESYRQAQLRQQEDALRKLNKEKQNERKWNEMESAENRRGELEQRQKDRLAKNEALNMMEENQRLAGDQVKGQQAMNRKYTENEPSEEYFQQFNTTSR